jgi:lysophospholipase L1-like esterase
MVDMLRTFKSWLLAGIFVGAASFASSGAFAADTLISPDDPGINYYGRFDFSNPKAPRFNWSGSIIELSVSNSTTVGIELTDGAGYYDIEVDGMVQSTPLYADSYNSKKYVLVSALSTDAHVIRIVKRNEPYWVITTFSGIYLSSGAKIMHKDKPVRKMEFCGDSYTAGYFIESCADQQANTNTNKSWARVTSQAFKAQDIIMAESGIGLVKSLGGKTCLPKKYLGTFDTIGGAPTPMWNFSTWIPDIVTVFLGINDKSSGATDNEYTAAVHSFVTTIRGNYPNARVLFIAYTGCMDEATKSAVAAETTSLGHKGIYSLLYSKPVNGCSWHPTVTDAKEISDSVVTKIKQITGWDTTPVSVTHSEIRNGAQLATQINATHIDNRTILISAHQVTAGSPIKVTSASGRVVKQLQLDLSGKCRWNTAQTSEGIYFIGGLETGWTRVCIER